MAANKNDICVIGIGKFGQSIVEQLIELNRHVLALDSDESKLIQVSRLTDTAIIDGADIEGLKALGIDKFNTVIVANTDNIEIVAAIIELGVKHVIAKAKSARHERVLKQIGVDVIVRPEAEAGIRTALIATNSNFIKYSELLQEIGDGYAIGSTIVNDLHWIGKPLKDLGFSKLGVNIVSIKTGAKVALPSGNTQLKSGDLVTIIGKIADITKAFAELNDEGSTHLIKLSKIEKASEMSKSKRKEEMKQGDNEPKITRNLNVNIPIVRKKEDKK